jgi:hypothetical protein
MKATPLIAAVFAVALHGYALADDQSEAVEMATDNLSFEMSQCASFHKVVAACLFRSNQNEGAEQVRKSAVAYLEMAAWLAKRAGISKLDETLVARDNMAVKDMRKSIDDDCRSVSILLDKYADRCKAILHNPSTALREYIVQVQQRMKGSR